MENLNKEINTEVREDIKCLKCGFEMEENQVFCSKCGTKVKFNLISDILTKKKGFKLNKKNAVKKSKNKLIN